jgi:hypothetical protein
MTKLEWVAHYSDGREVRESQTKYGELDRNLLDKFGFVDEIGKVHAETNISKDEAFFYRRRTFAVGTPQQYSLFLFGCRRKDGSNRIYVLRLNGEVTEDNIFRNEWYEPQWLPQETP